VAKSEFIPVIGLEVHAQLLTRSKAFCGCPTNYGADPNRHTCPVCLGLPGVLPVLNREMVDMALRLALALGAQVRPVSQFARKNYFYPDLPKGYQISQFDRPLAEGGAVEFDCDGAALRVGLLRLHLEEDAGKSFHDGGHSLVDFNRCGVPLVEIVSEPEIESPAQARAYLTELRRLLQYLEVCSGNMEEGALRCDANVSLRDPATGRMGTPTEMKNMNSFRGVQRALEYEIERQSEVLRSGGAVVRQTLLWDEAAGEARPMRRKELAHDYRYFPEPDLVLLEVDPAWMAGARDRLPELPRARERRFQEQYGIQQQQAQTLCADRALADYYEVAAAASGNPVLAANVILAEVQRWLKDHDTGIGRYPVDPERLGGLLQLLDRGTLSTPLAREVLQEMLAGVETAEQIVARRGLAVMGDEAVLGSLVRQVVEANPEEVARYRAGKRQLFGFFMGELMKATRGKGDPVKLRELLQKALEG